MLKIETKESSLYLDDEYFNTVLAAFFHDIGKVFYRVEGKRGSEVLLEVSRLIENFQVSRSEKIEGHEKIGELILKYLEKDTLFQDKIYSGYFSKVSEGKRVKITHLADWIASSEREDFEEEKDEKSNEKKKELISIFDKNIKYPLLQELDERIYKKDRKKSQIQKISELLTNLKTIFNNYSNLAKSDHNEALLKESFLRTVDLIMKNYTFQMSSSFFYSKPTIDLYSHNKLTTSLVAILWKIYHTDKDKFDSIYSFFEELKNQIVNNTSQEELYEKMKKDIKNNPLLRENHIALISGDFSGIQKFIGDVKTKHGLRMLKARSTFINFLSKNISKEICEEIYGLPFFNIVNNSGGHFQILVYIDDEKEKELKRYIKKVNEILFENFGGQLFIALTIRKFPIWALKYGLYKYIFLQEDKELEKDIISPEKELVKILHEIKEESIIQSKAKKFQEILSDRLSRDPKTALFIFSEEEYEEGKEKGECTYCHNKISEAFGEFSNQEEQICATCFQILEIIEVLKRIEVGNFKEALELIKSLIDKVRINKNIIFPLKKDDVEKIRMIKQILKRSNLLDREEYEFFSNLFLIFGPYVLGYPYEDGHKALSFENISKIGEKEFEDLAILKIDVDGLGTLIKNFASTLSHYYRLTTDLSLFFEKKVEEIFKRTHLNKYMYIVFSGGDDLVAIGRWDKLLEFFNEVRKEFEEWFGNGLTFSASYFIFNENFPVKYVYEYAEKLLEEGKRHGKNKIMIMEAAVTTFPINHREDSTIQILINNINKNIEKNNSYDLFLDYFSLVNYLLENKYISISALWSIKEIITKNVCPNLIRKKVSLRALYSIKYRLNRNLSINESQSNLKREVINLFLEPIKRDYKNIYTDNYSSYLSESKSKLIEIAILLGIKNYKMLQKIKKGDTYGQPK